MTARAPRVCARCNGVHPHGVQCQLAAAADRERKARHDAKRPSARARGYDADWRKVRAEHLTSNPRCKRCGDRATLVDHITPIRLAPHRRLDRTNLMSLCTPCHSGWKQAKERNDQ